MHPARRHWLVRSAAWFMLAAGMLVASAVVSVRPPQGNLRLLSSAFKEGERIPARHTCESNNVSPPLSWSGIPAGTKSLILMLDDADAAGGMFTHWIVYDLPVHVNRLPEEVVRTETISEGGRHGLNDFKKLGYDGPCPPAGQTHRYCFRLFALDAMLELKPGAPKKEVWAAMQKRVLAETQLSGTVQKR